MTDRTRERTVSLNLEKVEQPAGISVAVMADDKVFAMLSPFSSRPPVSR